MLPNPGASTSPTIDKTPLGYAIAGYAVTRRALRDAGLWDSTPVASAAGGC
jgi:hypothetical protein